MEHIVQFGINLDDSSIAEAIKRDAYKDVIKQLKEEARQDLPSRYCHGGGVDWKGMFRESIDEEVAAIVSEKQDEIVEMAVKRVYDSLTRRKSFRDACKRMDVVFDGLGGDGDD
jgi:hypothetical protein